MFHKQTPTIHNPAANGDCEHGAGFPGDWVAGSVISGHADSDLDLEMGVVCVTLGLR